MVNQKQFCILLILAVISKSIAIAVYNDSASLESFDKGSADRNSDRLLRRREVKNGSYILVGYHGTCSNHRESIEERIAVSSRSTSQFSTLQLGHGFYTADSKYVAIAYGRVSCKGYRRSFASHRFKPILCAVFMESQSLRKLPKIFLPSSIPNVSGNPFPLWYNDDNIKRIEELAFPNQKSPVRFAFLPTDLSKSEQLQAAWPENATNDMVAKCIDAPEPEDLDASIYREDAGYNELLYDSRDGKSYIKNWGSPVFGAEAYDRYNDPVEVLARRKISTFTDLLRKDKQKTE